MTKKEERKNKLISILKSNNGSSIKTLSKILDVSEMTIRRDIKELEGKNVIETFHGSVVYNPKMNNPMESIQPMEYDLHSNSWLMETEKNKIGKKAVELIEEGDIIMIDSGTTTEKLSQNIGEDIQCTALIASSNNLIHLMYKSNIDILFSGGTMHRDTCMFESAEGLDLINSVRATKLFLSAAGVHDKLGITCANAYETETKKRFIANSLKVILLVDSSKFGVVKSAHFCDMYQVDTIITDSGISDDWKKIIEDSGIELILC